MKNKKIKKIWKKGKLGVAVGRRGSVGGRVAFAVLVVGAWAFGLIMQSRKIKKI